MIYDCVNENLFEYFQLLCKFRKNDTGLINGINKCDLIRTDGFTPLTKLVISDYCTREWLQLLLSFDGIDINQRCQNKDENYFNKHALDLVPNEELRKMLVDRL